MLFRVLSVFGCALLIPRGCRIRPHLALMIPRVGLNWPPGMNRSLYLKCANVMGNIQIKILAGIFILRIMLLARFVLLY